MVHQYQQTPHTHTHSHSDVNGGGGGGRVGPAASHKRGGGNDEGTACLSSVFRLKLLFIFVYPWEIIKVHLLFSAALRPLPSLHLVTSTRLMVRVSY